MDVLNYINETGASIDEALLLFNISSTSSCVIGRIYLKHKGLMPLNQRKRGVSSMKKESRKNQTSRRISRGITSRNRTFTNGECVFKKVECLSSRKGKITNKDKAQVIYELRDQFNVKELVKLAGHST